jgi:hypothetical protein
MTVQEQLKAAGWTDADIAGFDAQKLKGIETVYQTAQQEREAAELAQRSATQMFENEISPALNAWGNKETNLTAELNYYKTLAEKAKDGGFIAEVPPFKAGERDPGGRFVANENKVPGSPDFRDLENKVVGAIGTVADLQWKYSNLFGTGMPDSPTSLLAEASAQKMTLPDYVAKKYDFAGKEASKRAEEQKKHDDAIRAEATAEIEKKYAEAGGSNPAIRMAQTSRYAELKKGVESGTRIDPLKMSRDQRRAATTAGIRQDIAATVN